MKTGLGGIRDIEFLVQGLQLVHLFERPELLTGNTLKALDVLRHREWIDPDEARQVAEDYRLLRRVEHLLQILEDRQTHTLPRDESQRAALARRVLSPGATADDLEVQIRTTQTRVRALFDRFVEGRW